MTRLERFRKFWHDRPYLGVFAVFVILLALGTWNQKRSSDQRDLLICQAVADSNAVLLDLIQFGQNRTNPQDVSDPDLSRLLEESQQRSRRFFEYARDRLQVPPRCVDVLNGHAPDEWRVLDDPTQSKSAVP